MMQESNGGDGAYRGPRGPRGTGAGGRNGGTGRASERGSGGARADRARAVGGRAGLPGTGGSRDRFGGPAGARSAGDARVRGGPRGGASGSSTGYRGSGVGYRGSGVGGSNRGVGRSSASAAGRDAGSGGSRYRGAAPAAARGAAPAAARDAAPSRRAQVFRSPPQRDGGRSSSKGGWDRPGPRRDGPAASRRDGPGGRREAEAEDFSDFGPLPSSIGRAATTGRNLWPRAPRAPRSDPRGAPQGEYGGRSQGVSRSSGPSRPAATRRSPADSGYQRPSPARRSPGALGKPFGRGGQVSEASGGRGSAKVRRALGGDQVEGRQAVRELLAAQRRAVHEVWMMEGSDPAAILREIQ